MQEQKQALPEEEFRCRICPRRCGALRSATLGEGLCAMPSRPVIARAAPHFGEEPCLSGTRGSGAIFFSGCVLRCCFCQNYSISAERFGRTVMPDSLGDCFESLKKQGVHNINLVNPTHFTTVIRRQLIEHHPGLPIVWNSGGYERVESLHAMRGLVDVYLPDLKYTRAKTSAAYSDAPDYFEFASAAILEMADQAGEAVFSEDGLLQRGLIVRHLILPSETAQSIEVLEWIKSELPEGTMVSLMCQYTPAGNLDGHPKLNRRITRREYDKVIDRLFALGLENGYVQEMGSAGGAFIPAFDLTGVPEK